MKQLRISKIWIISLLIFVGLMAACNSGDSAEEYINQGLATNEDGNLEQAIVDYTKAIELDPNSVEAYFNRGIAYQVSDNWEQAIVDYTKTIELGPDYKEAYFNRGDNYYILNNPEQAIADYTKAIELDPNYALAHRNRGYTFFALAIMQHDLDSGALEQSIADFDQYLELVPDAPDQAEVNEMIRSATQGINLTK